MHFVNREYELEFLNSKWEEGKPQLLVIYGKRRVGKTELAVQFAKGKPHLYFLCERISPKQQLLKFTEALKDYFKEEFLPHDGFRDWEMAFKYIAHKNEKVLIILDEFPYLMESDAGVSSTFQKIWDLHLKNSKVDLIILGSSISMMEQIALHYKAPLYGRRTGQLLVKPFKFAEAKKIFPGASFEKMLSIYTTVGGTPLYLNKFYKKEWLETVQHEILRKGEPLYEEVEFLLREELREPRNYFAILEALSLGKQKVSEIINATGLDKGTVSRYLSILESLQLIKKEIPVTEKIPEKSRKGIYQIEDLFFKFWFRFIFPNRALLEENKVKEVAAKITAAIPSLLANEYEHLAAEIFSSSALEHPHLPKFERSGRWWDPHAEIDLVAVNPQTNEILFGEAKWSNKLVGTNIYEELKQKASKVEWGKPHRKEYFALFSKSGFTPTLKQLAKQEALFLFSQDKLL